MSRWPEAVDRRLREVAQLHHLGVTIRKAKKIAKVGEVDVTEATSPHEAARR